MLRRKRIDRGAKVRSDTVYVLASPGDLLYLAGPRLALVVGLVLLPVVLAPWPYWERVALSAVLLALLAMSFDFLANAAGLLSLGGALFWGVGAYAAALLDTVAGLPWFATVPLATAAGAVTCTLLLLPALALRGIYFAVVTLMLPLLAVRVIEALDVLGGTEGLRGVDPLPGRGVEWALVLGVLLVALFGLRRFLREDPGLVLRAIREDDQAVRAAGIDVTGARARALLLASAMGCFPGAVYVHLYGSVGVSSFALDLSILPIAATVLGGGGGLLGALIGSLILVPLGEVLRDFGSLRIAVYALLLAGFVVGRSEGLLAWAARRYHQFERWEEG